ncbi:MAG: DUF4332 domain-containing protein [Candidatus Sericytochromatia bacterium]
MGSEWRQHNRELRPETRLAVAGSLPPSSLADAPALPAKLEQLLRLHSQIGARRAQLLARVGVQSLAELARRNPVRLAQALNQANQTAQLTQEIYARATIQKWIDEAADLQTSLSQAQEPDFAPADATDTQEQGPGETDPWAAVRLALQPDLPAEILTSLCDIPEPGVRWALLQRRDLNPGLMQRLARDRDPAFLSQLLSHPLVDSALLAEISGHPEAGLREQVAAHARCSSALLKELARDEAACVRVATASNPATPLQTLARLGHDADPAVRLAVVQNSSTGRAVLRRMHKDPDPLVRKAVAAIGSQPQLAALARDPVAEIRRLVARRVSDQQVLARLAGDPEPSVRRLVAANPVIEPPILGILAQDRDSSVRAAVAAHPACSQDLLLNLARDAESPVKLAVLGNAGLSEAVRQAVLAGGLNHELELQLAGDPRTPAATLALLAAGTANNRIRIRLVLNPGLPPELLDQLLDKLKAPRYRQELARASQTLPPLREFLVREEAALVREPLRPRLRPHKQSPRKIHD